MYHINAHTINPYLRTAQQCIIPTGSGLQQRIIFDYEIVYIESGTIRINYDGTDYMCKSGDFILLHPGVSHCFYTVSEDVSQPHIHFDLIYTANSRKTPISFKNLDMMSDEEKTLIQDDLFPEHHGAPFVTFSDKSTAVKMLFSAIDYFQKQQPLLAKSAFLELLNLLIQENFTNCFGEANNYAITRQIKDYIDSGQGISMSLEDFEKQFAYNRYYLEKQFKKKYGISLISYRNTQKMKLACHLLETLSVTEVSNELDFSSVYAFSRAFKNHMGINPTDYKRRSKT